MVAVFLSSEDIGFEAVPAPWSLSAERASLTTLCEPIVSIVSGDAITAVLSSLMSQIGVFWLTADRELGLVSMYVGSHL